jgi:hypothetical protein
MKKKALAAIDSGVQTSKERDRDLSGGEFFVCGALQQEGDMGMYSAAMLRKRTALRSHPGVIEGVNAFWQLKGFTSAFALEPGEVCEKCSCAEEHPARVLRSVAYKKMMKRFFKLLVADDTACMHSQITQDWIADIDGEPHGVRLRAQSINITAY